MSNQGVIEWSAFNRHATSSDGLRKHGRVTIGHYPSGEPLTGFPALEGASVDRVFLRPMSMLDLMGGLFFVDALMERGACIEPELILPFVSGARQDRLNNEGDYLFTAKSVAKEINARGFSRVTVLDPHSEVTPALIDRCRVIHAHECLAMEWQKMPKYAAVISPDAGAEKRAGAVAKRLGVPLLHGWKTREIATGKITGFGLERTEIANGSIQKPHVLVVDDICDGGGTFIGLADAIREQDLRADLYVTHGIFSQGTLKLTANYGAIYCTDSIDRPHTPGQDVGVHTIEVCKKLWTT